MSKNLNIVTMLRRLRMHSFAVAYHFDKNQRQFISKWSYSKSIDEKDKKSVFYESGVLTDQDALQIGALKKFHAILLREAAEKKTEVQREVLRIKEEELRATMPPDQWYEEENVEFFDPDSMHEDTKSVEEFLMDGNDSGRRSTNQKSKGSPSKDSPAKKAIRFKIDDSKQNK